MTAPLPSEDHDWFRTLLDAAADVYFRYQLVAPIGFVYLSPSVRVLTGHGPDAFYTAPSLCLDVIAPDCRHALQRVLRARRPIELALDLQPSGARVPVELYAVPVTRSGRRVAVEGVLRHAGAASARDTANNATGSMQGAQEPVPQRLAALMYEVHDLLHGVLPSRQAASPPARTVTAGAVTLDLDRMTVTENGAAVTLTSRELMVLRYFMLRPGRVITRQQLLTDVWDYAYTGDDRTVDVHVSRLRRKLPTLASRLVAIKHVGYRLDDENTSRAGVANT